MSLVERMLELTPLLSPRAGGSGPRMPGKKERVKRVPGKPPGIIKIESTDRQIDHLVSPTRTSYEFSPKGMISRKGTMYGLSEEGVKVVEGKE